jgi:hypothetical protein
LGVNWNKERVSGPGRGSRQGYIIFPLKKTVSTPCSQGGSSSNLLDSDDGLGATHVEVAPDDGWSVLALSHCPRGRLGFEWTAESVFTGTWRARFIGSHTFSKTGRTRCAMFLWAALQTHRILQGYIAFDVSVYP